jgi:mono/diheme cytochrome c family protein
MNNLFLWAMPIFVAVASLAADGTSDPNTLPAILNPYKQTSETPSPAGVPFKPLVPPPSTSLAAAPQPALTNALVWDSMNKEYKASLGDTNAILTFSVTNTSAAQAVIRSVRPSCGCTIATVPSNPWILAPGESGQFKINTDLRGKRGALKKYIVVDSTQGYQLIHMTVMIPAQQSASGNLDSMRGRNMMVALADRQAVFKGSCAQCHVTPGVGKTGSDLYDAACGICHDVPNRASMVPDLYALRQPKTREYWRKWTADGREGTLMPGFAKNAGGPLDAAQIDSLVEYLVTGFTNVIANPSLRKGNPGAAPSK